MKTIDEYLEQARAQLNRVTEWRLAQSSEAREVELTKGGRVILVCDAGYQSSLAAASLQELGIENATDLVGGYQAYLTA